MRGLEVPQEVLEALGGGKRPRVAITINGHSWKSRVAIMRGRNLLGLSNANRRAAGVQTGDEVEVDVELDAGPRVLVEPPDFARALDADPVARVAYDGWLTAASSSTCAPSRRQRSRRRGHGGLKRRWLLCETRSRQGTPRGAGGPELGSRLPSSPELDDPAGCALWLVGRLSLTKQSRRGHTQ
jgi:hypothetical protein